MGITDREETSEKQLATWVAEGACRAPFMPVDNFVDNNNEGHRPLATETPGQP
jgi:hypothetical protein